MKVRIQNVVKDQERVLVYLSFEDGFEEKMTFFLDDTKDVIIDAVKDRTRERSRQEVKALDVSESLISREFDIN
jgi:hypothetical protein